MAHIFKYAVLMAIPDRLRGERVNVGIIVFRPTGADVRLSDVAKLRALAGGDWDGYASDLRHRLIERFGSDPNAADAFVGGPAPDPIIQASDLAWFSIGNVNEYEAQVADILKSLVVRPRGPARPRSTRINTEIARQLKGFKVLASPDETINEHKVVRNFTIDRDEGLIADFALKNGLMHIATTVDLRKATINPGDAALKAITLDKAAEKYPKNVHLLGVYAADDFNAVAKPSIKLLTDYADKAYNWLDEYEKREFLGELRKAAAQPFTFGASALGRGQND